MPPLPPGVESLPGAGPPARLVALPFISSLFRTGPDSIGGLITDKTETLKFGVQLGPILPQGSRKKVSRVLV